MREAERAVRPARQILNRAFLFLCEIARAHVLCQRIFMRSRTKEAFSFWNKDMRRRQDIQFLSTKILDHANTRFVAENILFNECGAKLIQNIAYSIRQFKQMDSE